MRSVFAPAPTLTEWRLSSSVQGDGERNVDTQDAMVGGKLWRGRKESDVRMEEEDR